jgi:hypothetical protein
MFCLYRLSSSVSSPNSSKPISTLVRVSLYYHGVSLFCLKDGYLYLQSLLNSKPYHNEPGYEKERRAGDVEKYNRWVFITGCRPPPPFLCVAKAGRNHLNEEIVPLLPTGIGEGYSQTISHLELAALLCRCEIPL